MSSLIPGYNHVEAFAEDGAYECENGGVVEEVEYVTLDLGMVEPTLVPSSSSYRVVGLDTPTPFLQLSGTMLKGQHSSLLGTELLFTEASEEHQDRGKKSLVHVANTERRIRFREVELKPKQEGVAAQPSGPSVAKSSSTAKKVKSQMQHVMAGSAGPSRRARSGRKRGSSSRAPLRDEDREDDADTSNAVAESGASQPGNVVPEADAASMAMDTSGG